MSDTAVMNNNVSEQTNELTAEMKNRRRDLNGQQQKLDEQETKLKKSRRNRCIFMAVMAVLIIVMLVVKYVVYFRPENVKEDKQTKAIAADIDVNSLQVMPYNEDLTVACQPILIANSKDNTVKLDLISPQNCKVLVRAEIFADKKDLGNKKLKLFWHGKVHPDDESLVRIGATGWVRPGEMIDDMKLDELPTRLSDVTVRFTAVNPANYNISSGVFDMKTVMHIVDYEGNMMDENGNWVKAG